MKKVVRKEELQEKMQEAIDLLCDTVKSTLGPKGDNVIIDHSSFSPFITNDGVTIAMNIESDDAVINTILELAKEAAINTNQVVGDGTTTTLVLLQSIFNYGRRLIQEGLNPIILRKELKNSLKEILAKIAVEKIVPRDEELRDIAITSANSSEIGSIVSEAFLKTKNKRAIDIVEGTDKTEVIKKSGYIIDSQLASPYFFKGNDQINVKKPKVLLVKNNLNDLEEIADIVNDIEKNDDSLIILADDYSDYVINQSVSLLLNNELKIYLLKWSEFGKKKVDIMSDVSVITGSSIDEKNFDYGSLGSCLDIKITLKEVVFSFKENKRVKERLEDIELEIKENNDEREFLERRKAMLNNELIEIRVGAATKTERREKKMRYDDCLGAISSASKGVLPGSGIILYKISKTLDLSKKTNFLFAESLKEVLKQILRNAGLNEQDIILEIEKSNFQKIYNVKTNEFEDSKVTKVLDAQEVVEKALINAVAIASMLLTTSALIINEYQNNLNKVNDFNEF